MLMGKALISIVDDDESVREATEGLMKACGFRVQTFSSAIEFLASPHMEETSCMIADINMPHMTGVELYEHLIKHGYRIPTILITAYPAADMRARLLARGLCSLSD